MHDDRSLGFNVTLEFNLISILTSIEQLVKLLLPFILIFSSWTRILSCLPLTHFTLLRSFVIAFLLFPLSFALSLKFNLFTIRTLNLSQLPLLLSSFELFSSSKCSPHSYIFLEFGSILSFSLRPTFNLDVSFFTNCSKKRQQ